MTHATNKWDSAFLFYAPKFVTLAIFVSISFTPDSWTTPMIVVGFTALAIEVVLDILRYRHLFAKQDEEEVEQVVEDTPSHDQAKKTMSKWEKIEKWYEPIENIDTYVYFASLVVVIIFILCTKFVLPWFK
ncbi:MAG: hypothetical protein J6B59_00025 [Alistipes sp.]|nr:hypothetical protein [Alistipes sp.]